MNKIQNKLLGRYIFNLLLEAKFHKMPIKDVVEILAYLKFLYEYSERASKGGESYAGNDPNKENFKTREMEKVGDYKGKDRSSWRSRREYTPRAADWMTGPQKEILKSFDIGTYVWGGLEPSFWGKKIKGGGRMEGPVMGATKRDFGGRSPDIGVPGSSAQLGQGHIFNKVGPGWFITHGNVAEWVVPIIEEYVSHFYQQNKQALKSPQKASSYDDPKRGKDTLKNRMAKTLRGQTLKSKGGRKSTKERFKTDHPAQWKGGPTKINLQRKITLEAEKFAIAAASLVDYDKLEKIFSKSIGLDDSDPNKTRARFNRFIKHGETYVKRELKVGFAAAIGWYLEGEMERVIRGYQDIFSKMFADKSEKEQAKYLVDIMLTGDSADMAMGRDLATSLGKGSTYATEPMAKFEDLEESKIRIQNIIRKVLK